MDDLKQNLENKSNLPDFSINTKFDAFFVHRIEAVEKSTFIPEEDEEKKKSRLGKMLNKAGNLFPNNRIIYRVDINSIAIITEGRPLYDRENLQEVYFGGEVIILDPNDLDIEDPLEIVELIKIPGMFQVSLKQYIDKSNFALIEGGFEIEIVEPQKIISKVSNYHNANADDELRDQIKEMIDHKLEEWTHHDANIWTGDVAAAFGALLVKLDKMLSAVFGVKIRKANIVNNEVREGAYVYRKFPETLYDLVWDCRFSEVELLKQLDELNPNDTHALGYTFANLPDIKTFIKHHGVGSGIFDAATEDKETIQKFYNWNNALDPVPFQFQTFLKNLLDMYNDNLLPPPLYRQVVLAAFENPLIGLGEWGEGKGNIESSRVAQIQKRLES